ncbi:hypothetical protein PR048_013301, partial [Dryococelus australis]
MNTGFGSPTSDVSSFCLLHKDNLKFNPDDKTKCGLETELSVHKLKAKSFYKNFKTVVQGEKVFSFECHKNLTLPKLPKIRHSPVPLVGHFYIPPHCIFGRIGKKVKAKSTNLNLQEVG